MATDQQTAGELAREYFGSIRRGDSSPQERSYLDGPGRVDLGDMVRGGSKHDLIAFFEAMWAAFPDWTFEPLDYLAEGDAVACRWRVTGTFAGPGHFQGFAPTGARIDLRGVDVVRFEGGRIAHNEVFVDGMQLARQLGAVPPAGSAAERQMAKAVNARTKLAGLGAGGLEEVAEGVWLIRGGFPSKTMNVYFVRDGDGVLVYDAGIKAMRGAVAAAGAQLGGITRVVLGHGHQDHRGVAPFLGVPVLCHPDARAQAEGDGGFAEFHLERLNPIGRRAFPHLLRHWDGGPVQIAGTVEEGDDVAGFRVVLLDGHAPGLIGLWRESDRLALVSDTFYTLDPQTGRHGAPRVPHAAFNQDTERARASIRKLAALEPAAAWPGHADPVTGDVRAQLEQAAAST